MGRIRDARTPGCHSFRKEGSALRINDAYEHDSILPCREDSCPINGCNKVCTQCVDVSTPLVLTPTAVVGTATVTCQGTPTTVCVTDPSGTSCTVTMTQRVCVSVPIRYGVTLTSSEPAIACAEGAGTGGGCSCGC